MKIITTRFLAIFLIVVVFSASIMSCSSTTMINSVPPGAKVYMNGELKGNTPYRHSDMAVSGTSTDITLKKEGYEDFMTILSKNEDVNVGAIVGGVFFLFPFIWTMGYNYSHTYELVPAQ